MDFILEVADHYVLDNVWAKMLPAPGQAIQSTYSDALNHTIISASSTSAWQRDYIPRQIISISFITLFGIHILYFLFASLSYFFIFNLSGSMPAVRGTRTKPIESIGQLLRAVRTWRRTDGFAKGAVEICLR